MPRGTTHIETGMLRKSLHGLYALEIDDGGVWRLDTGWSLSARRYIDQRVIVEGIRSGFDLLDVERLEPVQSAQPKPIPKIIPLLGLLCAACDGQAERLVREELVDPQSTEFSEVATKGNVTCGLVNSKNRMGGYTGRQLFLVRDGEVFFWRNSADVDQSMLSACSTEAFTVALRDFEADMREANR